MISQLARWIQDWRTWRHRRKSIRRIRRGFKYWKKTIGVYGYGRRRRVRLNGGAGRSVQVRSRPLAPRSPAVSDSPSPELAQPRRPPRRPTPHRVWRRNSTAERCARVHLHQTFSHP